MRYNIEVRFDLRELLRTYGPTSYISDEIFGKDASPLSARDIPFILAILPAV